MDGQFTVYMERSAAVRILGELLTFRIPAVIINMILIVISISLLVETGLSLISILAVLLVFAPMFFMFQFRYIARGGRALKRQNTITLNGKDIILSAGFPHFTTYETRKIPVNQLLSIQIKGDEVLGYYVQLNDKETREKYQEVEELPAGRRAREKHKIRPLRFGLWQDLNEAREMAATLSEALNIPLVKD